MKEAPRHLTHNDFTLYYLRQLSRPEREEIRRHSRTCRRCKELAKEVREAVYAPVWWSPEAYGEAVRREREQASPAPEAESPEAAAFVDAVLTESRKVPDARAARHVRIPARALIYAQAAAIVVLAILLWRAHVPNPPPLVRNPPAASARPPLDAALTDPGLPEEWRVRAGELLVDGVVKQLPATVAALAPTRTRLVVRGAPQDVSADPIPLSPFSEAVPDGRPTFRWRPVAGADRYRIFVRDGNGHTLLNEDAGNRTEFPWPAGQPPLNPGGRYDWQVAARVAGRSKVAPWDSFAVLGEAQQRQVAELLGELANQPLALAAIDESFGLYDEAASQLRNLQAEYPGDSRPQQMLDSLTALRKATR